MTNKLMARLLMLSIMICPMRGSMETMKVSVSFPNTSYPVFSLISSAACWIGAIYVCGSRLISCSLFATIQTVSPRGMRKTKTVSVVISKALILRFSFLFSTK